MKTLLILAVAGCLVAPMASAQMQQPYAGLDARQIKSLSEQQISDLQNGRGMGLALAAELNGYPGPAHVLELADKLGLSAEQKARISELFAAMKAEAVPLGEQLITQEAALDALFAGHSATPASVAAATAAIGDTQGRLRAAHLKYHLSTLDALQPAQVQRYAELRGYGAGAPPHQHKHP
jgi:Spy/CpxP family protein refolding chaperone